MKITFLCGSLQPGCDGVGDYTKRLALELIALGNQVNIVALNDKHITTIQHTDGTQEDGLLLFRIPANLSENDRFSLAKNWIELQDPDLISLQFVIYSFHHKGLPFGLGKRLKELMKSRHIHIMFHEIWVGFTKISPLKHKITGFFQKSIISSIIDTLKPNLITTSNRLYQLILGDHKIKATILPLFSNIPKAPFDDRFVSVILQDLNIDDRKGWILSGIFGNLYPQARLEPSITHQYKQAASIGKKFAFIGVGKMNSEGYAEFNRLKQTFEGKIEFLHLGEQPAENVSNLLGMLDVGFSCTPAQHIGKSGVFAAMKLHGLPVVLSSEDIIPEYDSEIKKYQINFVQRPEYKWSVEHTAECLLKLLHPLYSSNILNQ